MIRNALSAMNGWKLIIFHAINCSVVIVFVLHAPPGTLAIEHVLAVLQLGVSAGVASSDSLRVRPRADDLEAIQWAKEQMQQEEKK